MSLARRLDLLRWAKETGRFILEDDYDSEYRYTGRPLTSLQGLDDDNRVLYVGTMSKIMFSGLRVGYMVVPEDLRAVFFETMAHRIFLDPIYELRREPIPPMREELATIIEEQG